MTPHLLLRGNISPLSCSPKGRYAMMKMCRTRCCERWSRRTSSAYTILCDGITGLWGCLLYTRRWLWWDHWSQMLSLIQGVDCVRWANMVRYLTTRCKDFTSICALFQWIFDWHGHKSREKIKKIIRCFFL